MREEGQYDGRCPVCMCACRELADDLMMAAMDAVEDADGQPGVLEFEVVEGAEMCHSKRIGRE
jgi:hypothetical protein